MSEELTKWFETQEAEEKQIMKIIKKLPEKDKEELKRLIERQMDFQNKRLLTRHGEGYFYFGGQIDLWDKIFQALMEK